MQAGAAQAEALLSLLANRHRLMVMCHLIDGEKTVTELLARGQLGQSALSQHLGKLRDAHLVATRREGQKIHYSIASKQAQILIETLCDLYKP
ncbi:MAG: metalloregulator ArsR/SmtB family transcription factor [Rhizobiaceae bacterium]|nr:metalloregulator ArsR/SmtB family transcription factor [Rhizobiaceae bacterium]